MIVADDPPPPAAVGAAGVGRRRGRRWQRQEPAVHTAVRRSARALHSALPMFATLAIAPPTLSSTPRPSPIRRRKPPPRNRDTVGGRPTPSNPPSRSPVRFRCPQKAARQSRAFHRRGAVAAAAAGGQRAAAGSPRLRPPRNRVAKPAIPLRRRSRSAPGQNLPPSAPREFPRHARRRGFPP